MSMKLKTKKIIYVDVDGEFKDIPSDYSGAKPFASRIEYINSLYDDEKHTIIYWTARGCKSGEIDALYDLTKKQLKAWGAKHHDLQVGNKPHFDMYICDKSYNSESFFHYKERELP